MSVCLWMRLAFRESSWFKTHELSPDQKRGFGSEDGVEVVLPQHDQLLVLLAAPAHTPHRRGRLHQPQRAGPARPQAAAGVTYAAWGTEVTHFPGPLTASLNVAWFFVKNIDNWLQRSHQNHKFNEALCLVTFHVGKVWINRPIKTFWNI